MPWPVPVTIALPFINLGTLVETSLAERVTWREESLKGENVESILNQLKTVRSVEKNITPLRWPTLYSVLEGVMVDPSLPTRVWHKRIRG